MPTLLSRTPLLNGITTSVDTSTATNIVVNVPIGEIGCTAIIDSAQTTGYGFVLKGSAVVVAAADSIDFIGIGADGGSVEVYAA